MRKVYIFLLLVTVGINLSGCKKDKQVVKTPGAALQLTGSWKLTSLSTQYIFGDATVASINNQSTADYVDHINYNADGTGTMVNNRVTIRSFKYYNDSETIHYTDFKEVATGNIIGTGMFVSFIAKANDASLEITDKQFFFAYVAYENQRYDQLQRHIFLVKE